MIDIDLLTVYIYFHGEFTTSHHICKKMSIWRAFAALKAIIIIINISFAS